MTDAILATYQPKEALGEIIRFVQGLTGDDQIFIDGRVAQSEEATGHRNRALAHYLASCGNLYNPVAHTLGVYYNQCAVTMDCAQLSRAGRFLAFAGTLGPNRQQMVSMRRARRIAAIMLTCGHYDGSGDFAYRVGLPAKSGVSGMILAAVPGIAPSPCGRPGWIAMAILILARKCWNMSPMKWIGPCFPKWRAAQRPNGPIRAFAAAGSPTRRCSSLHDISPPCAAPHSCFAPRSRSPRFCRRRESFLDPPHQSIA